MANSVYVPSDLLGQDLEEAYAKFIDGKAVGGLQDGGIDIEVPWWDLPWVGFQVKSSIEGGRSHLRKCREFRRFIPVAVGSPPCQQEALLAFLDDYGAWCQFGLGGRPDFLLEAEETRAAIDRANYRRG